MFTDSLVRILLAEGMQNGQLINGRLRILNPFFS